MSDVAVLDRKDDLAEEPGDRVEAIRSLFDKIDQAEQTTDEVRWSAAELVAAEVADGKTTRDLAAELDRSAMYVSRYNRAWKRRQEDPSVLKGPFSRAYAPPRVTKGYTKDMIDASGGVVMADELRAFFDAFDPDGVPVEALETIIAEAEAFIENIRAWIEDAGAEVEAVG